MKREMDSSGSHLDSQYGSVLVIAILILLAITILGIMSHNILGVEMITARNERESKTSFYLAEAASVEAIQRLSDTSMDDLNDHIQGWHHGGKEEVVEKSNFRLPDHWDIDGDGEDNARPSQLDPHTFFAAVESDVATGASLIMTESRLYTNRIYGLCNREEVETIVEIGYTFRY